MNKILQRSTAFMLLLMAFLSIGCARSYKSISLDNHNFSSEQIVADSLKVSYLYDVQRLSNNKRYWKKEVKRNVAAVGIKIENISSDLILIKRETFKVYMDADEKPALLVEDYTKKVKQNVATHLLHALWGPWRFTYEENMSTGESKSEFRIIPIGAVVGIANAAVAGTANSKQRETLENNDIWNKYIKAGETVYGIILIDSEGFKNLTFTYNDVK